ncbi:MAG: electron transfer flavoprotein subunit alpha/FixB family protein [Candidatus Marinimicrobia bacterium]|nr:electron transfer flavoprotein subunit alpha/FixB family protein [Candidatus Neomarinimicrobiota bacterium]
MMKILVYIQRDGDSIGRNSIEALAGAQKFAAELSGEVMAVCLDSSLTEKLTGYNISEVITVSHDGLNTYSPLHFTAAMEQVIADVSANVVVFGHTYQVRDWAPRLSARLNAPFISDCVDADGSTGLTGIRQVYQGKINTNISAEGLVLMSFQSGAFRADSVETGSAAARTMDVDLSSVPATIRPGERFKESKGGVDLTRAEVVVSVGRGIGKEENIPLVKDLKESLGAELGSSRPVVDYGWLPHERQIGSSGQVVTPKMYLAVGISGAIQHQVGMKGSDNIVAINKDPNAPIFEIADYGVVADLFEILPKLSQSIKDYKS